jgi:aspartate kinase
MNLSVAKFGGGLLDREGRTIPLILKRIKDLRKSDGLGPIAVFSAPQGYTDELIRIGDSRAQSRPDVSIDPLFENYENIARQYVKAEHLEGLLSELQRYRSRTEEALGLVDRRFSGTVRARVLTNGGELPTSVLVEHILESEGLDSCHVSEERWPVVTDDDFENATPILEEARTRIKFLIEPLEDGKIVSMAGFLGVTTDGLDCAW